MGDTDSKKADSSKSDKKVEDKSKTGEATTIISEEEAINIVLGQVPGATITKIELDWDDGIQQYEIEAVLGDTEYDFEINAATGIILSWDEEYMDSDSDYDDDDDDDEKDDD